MLPRVPRRLHQALAAPRPRLLRRERLVGLLPHRLGDVVPAAALAQQRHAGPGQEDAQHLRPEVRGHADEVAHVGELALPVLRDRAAEVVVRGDGVDLDAAIVGVPQEVLAARLRPVERVAVRALPVDLHALVPVLLRPVDHLLQGQGTPAVPHAEVGDAVEADLHLGLVGGAEQLGGAERSHREGGGPGELTPARAGSLALSSSPPFRDASVGAGILPAAAHLAAGCIIVSP